MKFLAWILSVLFAFGLGAESAKEPGKTDEELRTKVREHIDVIVDEGAAIVDDITDSIREDDRVQDAEKFLEDVKDIAEETLTELNQVAEDTKDRVEEKFGTKDGAEESDGEESAAEELLEKDESEEPASQETPGPEDKING